MLTHRPGLTEKHPWEMTKLELEQEIGRAQKQIAEWTVWQERCIQQLACHG